ncbi:MAG: pseudaminic acid synthase [Flammeovirgaceae bacterium]|nr:pseudaminic acid synthase [Flammeovirgaceae bacterium]
MQIGNFSFENNNILIIAELSANHNGDIEVAKETIRTAKKTGANAIKLQTYTPDTLTIDCKKEYFQIKENSPWDGQYLYDLYKEAFTPWEWHAELFEVAKAEGLICFSSPFDKTAVDFLEKLNVPAYKIASFEIQDIPLIEYVASKGKPIIISTGIAALEDIELAVNTCKGAGNEQIILLKCTSSYPAPIDLANLNTMVDFRQKFKVIVGVSDHTMENTVPVVSTALGGQVIEKHFILDREMGGADSSFSLDPAEFKAMVEAVKSAKSSLGKVSYELSEKVKKNKKFARSLFVVKDIKKGEILSEENVRSIRPGYGLHPKYFNEILGKKVNEDIERGTPLNFEMIEFDFYNKL